MVLSRRLPWVVHISLGSVCLEPMQRLPLWCQATFHQIICAEVKVELFLMALVVQLACWLL